MFHNINDGEHLHLACRYSSNDQLFQFWFVLEEELKPASNTCMSKPFTPEMTRERISAGKSNAFVKPEAIALRADVQAMHLQ